MSKRTNSIVAVTLAKYATVYVEVDSPDRAAWLRLRPAVHALAKGGHVHLGPVLRHRQHRLAGSVSQKQG